MLHLNQFNGAAPASHCACDYYALGLVWIFPLCISLSSTIFIINFDGDDDYDEDDDAATLSFLSWFQNTQNESVRFFHL